MFVERVTSRIFKRIHTNKTDADTSDIFTKMTQV